MDTHTTAPPSAPSPRAPSAPPAPPAPAAPPGLPAAPPAVSGTSANSPSDAAPEPPGPGHVTSTAERGSFCTARCSCGWRGPARRSRDLARKDAEAHHPGGA
ncbi:hypothetical protein [Streptomyces sp. NPDC097619]|uniref:hypothetical protein n=1 Tax=Streptomyces sp. NPDC097619 TaxID=3157228 RepID=UPI00332BFFC9